MSRLEKDPSLAPQNPSDLEASSPDDHTKDTVGDQPTSAFNQLAILDRFLAIWIFLAMAIGIILGNFVPNTGPALQRGKFVGVSIPIGKSICCLLCLGYMLTSFSNRPPRNDVSHPM